MRVALGAAVRAPPRVVFICVCIREGGTPSASQLGGVGGVIEARIGRARPRTPPCVHLYMAATTRARPSLNQLARPPPPPPPRACQGGDQQKKVGTLSGGERNRLHMAKTFRSGGNLLLLGAPTSGPFMSPGTIAFTPCTTIRLSDSLFCDPAKLSCVNSYLSRVRVRDRARNPGLGQCLSN